MAPSIHGIPTSARLTRTLSELIGRPVQCLPGKPVSAAPHSPVVAATFVEKGGKLAAAWISDLALAASAGAALVMIPAGVAAECVRRGKLSEGLDENFHEVLNVCAGLLNSSTTPHVTLGDVKVGEKLAVEVAALAKAPAARLDVEVTIEGYVPGKLSLLVL